jgi:hypothetical protein
MDVSRSEAKRAQTNVIARSVDRATTTNGDAHCAKSHQSLRRKSQSFAQRIPVLCVENSSPLRRGLSAFARVVARLSHNRRMVVARLSNRRCAGRRAVVAAGDYVRAKTPLRSVFTLTSIAPTPLDGHILNRRHSSLLRSTSTSSIVDILSSLSSSLAIISSLLSLLYQLLSSSNRRKSTLKSANKVEQHSHSANYTKINC